VGPGSRRALALPGAANVRATRYGGRAAGVKRRAAHLGVGRSTPTRSQPRLPWRPEMRCGHIRFRGVAASPARGPGGARGSRPALTGCPQARSPGLSPAPVAGARGPRCRPHPSEAISRHFRLVPLPTIRTVDSQWKKRANSSAGNSGAAASCDSQSPARVVGEDDPVRVPGGRRRRKPQRFGEFGGCSGREATLQDARRAIAARSARASGGSAAATPRVEEWPRVSSDCYAFASAG
jgi:uncharacterized ParB-like nuclease family protein